MLHSVLQMRWFVVLASMTLTGLGACDNYGQMLEDWPSLFSQPAEIALVKAVCKDDHRTIDRLIKSGADVNATGDSGVTPLFVAVHCRSHESFDLLLKAGANANSILDDCTSLPWVASRIPDDYFISRLVAAKAELSGSEQCPESSALLGAISLEFQGGYRNNYDLLVSSGVDLNMRYGPSPGYTAAEKAVGLGKFSIALDLVQRGYDRDLNKLYEMAQRRPVDSNTVEFEAKNMLIELLSEKFES